MMIAVGHLLLAWLIVAAGLGVLNRLR